MGNQPEENVKGRTYTLQNFNQLHNLASANRDGPSLLLEQQSSRTEKKDLEPVTSRRLTLKPRIEQHSDLLPRPRWHSSTWQDCDDSQRPAGSAGYLHRERDHIKTRFGKAAQIGKIFEDRYVMREQCDV